MVMFFVENTKVQSACSSDDPAGISWNVSWAERHRSCARSWSNSSTQSKGVSDLRTHVWPSEFLELPQMQFFTRCFMRVVDVKSANLLMVHDSHQDSHILSWRQPRRLLLASHHLHSPGTDPTQPWAGGALPASSPSAFRERKRF